MVEDGTTTFRGTRTPLWGEHRSCAGPPGPGSHMRHTNVWEKAEWRGPADGPTVLKRGRDEMFPAVKPCIDGPLAGSDQRQRYAKHRQYGGNTRMDQRREGDPRLGSRRHNSSDGRPQTGDEQQAGERTDHLRRRNCAAACRGHAVQQSTADQQPLHQKPGARPAVCEVGEKPLHMYPVSSLRKLQRF